MRTLITTQYFKEYRKELGFTNQGDVKSFFAGKDIIPTVNYDYINLLNTRLVEIIRKINSLVSKNINILEIDEFCTDNVEFVFNKLKNNNIIQRLNNQGRRPEQVYFSWMRGYIISNYFLKALSEIFKVNLEDISLIGDDDLVNIESFKRTPTADLEIALADGNKLRIEVQSGFVGVNDIKQHKVLEAKRIFETNGVSSLAIHFDLFNGQVAFIKLDEIEDDNINWITRQQMEGQTVFNIDQNYFTWKLTENPPSLDDIFVD
ncbi:MAG: restriction endonuclease [Sulfurimonas sp.]|uniref:restriction endonuclease n=1 Tax=Sulfurimonas sp. TaxID=2022749 RepID=UPI002605707B|nr:restriction endonuclease [Sulfurimonas sp.]MCW8894551.1 restriction endonuclease [Sulfurimonas sp.]MCW8953757.1 restriction endonuclease [Sulfurimonas sp.]